MLPYPEFAMLNTATVAAKTIRDYRKDLRLSQADLARGSGVSRYKLNAFETGSGELTDAELALILNTLRGEIERLKKIPGPSGLGAVSSGEALA